MIIWIFAILDSISLIALSFAHFQINFSFHLLIMSSVYLIGKGLIFRDVMSLIDLAFGIYILLVAFFHISTFIYYLALIWFGYKLISTIVSLS